MVKLKIVLILVSFLMFIGLGIGTTITAPDNALVYINYSNNTYAGFIDKKPMRITRLSTAKAKNFSPDEASRHRGDFVQDGRSLTGLLFEKLGLLDPLPSRWNKDGTWNW